MPDKSQKDQDLLKRIRDDFRYCQNYWREVRDEMSVDMRYVSGDPWDPKDRAEREDNDRACAEPDELSQYLKQANNNLRQNKRAIKVSPKSEGATDKYAEIRSDIIRGIEYKSQAQAAYTTAFEQCTESGIGVARIVTEYINPPDHPDWAAVEPRIKRVPNQFTWLPDPDAKEADLSDQEKSFLIESIRQTEFARKYPNAEKTSFSADDFAAAPDWFKGENVIIAEAWYVEHTKRKKLRVESPEGPTSVYEDELPEKHGKKVLNERTETKRKVVQYITNGVEILERNEWPGSWIPLCGMFGEEIYVNDGGQSKRMILSLIRRARFPQKMLAFIASQELEEFGMAPRAPFIGYKGQFTDPNWPIINKVPQAFIEVEPQVDQSTGQVLPLPSRPQFEPNTQAYEISRESWRRAIQAAIGVTPLPTAAQRQNEKSGVALEKIQTQEAIGSFHFIDNHDRFLANIGRQLNELITNIMDTPRHVSVRKADGSHGLVALSINGKLPEGANPDEAFDPTKGEYDVTISTGPSYLSQREEAASFADTLIQNLQELAALLPQGAGAQLLAMAVKLREIGPIGDQIVKIIEGDPEGQLAQGQQAMAKLQQQTQVLQETQAELQKLQFEKAARVVDNQAKAQIEQIRAANDQKLAQLANDIKVLTALITAKTQHADQEFEMYKTFWMENHKAAHEAGMQAVDQAHESNMADKNAAIAQSAAAQQAALNPPESQLSAGPA